MGQQGITVKQGFAERLRAEDAERHPQPQPLSDAAIEARKQQQTEFNARYAEENVPHLVGTLAKKAEAANAEGKTRAHIEWEVDISLRPALRYTMDAVSEYFEYEGFTVNRHERDNSTPGGVVNDYDFVPGLPATQFTTELTIDWSRPAVPQDS